MFERISISLLPLGWGYASCYPWIEKYLLQVEAFWLTASDLEGKDNPRSIRLTNMMKCVLVNDLRLLEALSQKGPIESWYKLSSFLLVEDMSLFCPCIRNLKAIDEESEGNLRTNRLTNMMKRVLINYTAQVFTSKKNHWHWMCARY